MTELAEIHAKDATKAQKGESFLLACIIAMILVILAGLFSGFGLQFLNS